MLFRSRAGVPNGQQKRFVDAGPDDQLIARYGRPAVDAPSKKFFDGLAGVVYVALARGRFAPRQVTGATDGHERDQQWQHEAMVVERANENLRQTL